MRTSETDGQRTERERDREEDKRQVLTDRERGGQTERQVDSQTDRGVQTDRHTTRQAEVCRQTDTQTEVCRQTDTQTEVCRQTDRGVQTDRQTEVCRQTKVCRQTARGVQADRRQAPGTQDDVLVVGVEGEHGRGQQAGHGLVVPDDVVLPAAVHQLLVVDGEDGEPGGVLLLGH